MRLAWLAFSVVAMAHGNWVIHRHENLTVATDGGTKEAQAALATLVQTQHTLSAAFGKSLTPIWPFTVVMKKGSVEYRPAERRKPGYVIQAPYGQLAPRVIEDFVALLLTENSPPLGPSIDPALPVLFSTLAVQGPRVQIGTPVPDGSRTLPWALMHLIFTDDRYSGKVRALLGNLAVGADPEVAWKNAFGKTEEQLLTEAKAHLEGGTFKQAPLNGKPINPERFYREELNAGEVADLQAAAGDIAGFSMEQLQQTANDNPRWPEPHVRMATLETQTNRKAQRLRHAAQLAFRDVSLWRQAAELFAKGELPAEATKCWAGAERAAATKTEKAQMRDLRRASDMSRLNAEAELKRQAEEQERAELDRIKSEALARVRAAEARVNAGDKPITGKVEAWWDGPRPDAKVEGELVRVECFGARMRLHVRTASAVTILAVRDVAKLVLQGGGEMTLPCGVQAKKPRLTVEYFAKRDAKFGTVGDAAFITFAGAN